MIKSNHGIFQVRLPLFNDSMVATQTSCYASDISGTIKKMCFSCHLDSPFTGMVKKCQWHKTRGVIGGPHKILTEIESKYHINTTTFIKVGYQVSPDASLLHCKVEKDCFNDFISKKTKKQMKS